MESQTAFSTSCTASCPEIPYQDRAERGRLVARNSRKNRDLLRRKSDLTVELPRHRIPWREAMERVCEWQQTCLRATNRTLGQPPDPQDRHAQVSKTLSA